jgi:hypothetical protein
MGISMSQADSAITTNKDLLALATRLRDRADDVIADRTLAADLRAAADLASKWASIRTGWDNPDLSFLAIHELSERLNDYAETGAAVFATDVFLAMHAVDMLVTLIVSLRQIPNAPDNVDVREFVSRVMLQPIGVEPLTAEEMQPATEG